MLAEKSDNLSKASPMRNSSDRRGIPRRLPGDGIIEGGICVKCIEEFSDLRGGYRGFHRS